MVGRPYRYLRGAETTSRNWLPRLGELGAGSLFRHLPFHLRVGIDLLLLPGHRISSRLLELTGTTPSLHRITWSGVVRCCKWRQPNDVLRVVRSAEEMGLLSGETESEAAKDTKKPEHVVHHVDEAAQRGCGRCSQLLEGFSVLAICSTLKQVCLRSVARTWHAQSLPRGTLWHVHGQETVLGPPYPSWKESNYTFHFLDQ